MDKCIRNPELGSNLPAGQTDILQSYQNHYNNDVGHLLPGWNEFKLITAIV